MDLVSPISRRLPLKAISPSREACSIIVPVYNNQGTLEELCLRIHSTLDSRGLTYKVYLVIDGSPDKSAEVADAIASKDPHIRVINLKKNHGQSKATLEGLKQAGGRISVIMDADLQDEPEIIPTLVEKLSKENPIVFAAKTGRYQSWHRLFTASAFRLARSAVVDLPQNAGGFVAFSNTVKQKLMAMEPWPQISTMLGILPFSKSAVCITRPERKDGKSSWTSTARFKAGLKTIFLALRYRVKETFGPGYRWLLAAFPLFFLISLAMSVMHGVNKGDEAWILQVIDRIKHGEALYHDIFYGTTPLAIWLGTMFCNLFGLQVLSIKIYAALLQALLCVLSGLLILKAGGKTTTALLTSAAVYLFGYENLGSGPLYNALSFVFLLSLAVRAYPSRQTWDIAPVNLHWSHMVTGGMIALCILSKHTVGFFALCAYSALFIFRYFNEPMSRKPRLGQLLTVLLSTGAILVLALGTGLHGDSWEKFYEYCFTNKTGYIKLSSISYTDQWMLFFSRHDWTNIESLKDWFMRLQYFFPGLSVLLLLSIAVFSKGSRRIEATAILLFCSAGFLNMFPRADVYHVSFSASFSILGIVMAILLLNPTSLSKKKISTALYCAATVMLVAGFLFLNHPLYDILKGERVHSSFQPMFGSFIDKNELAYDQHSTAALKDALKGEQAMLQVIVASYYYLTSGIKNPTPWDYPLKNAFGKSGEEKTINRIQKGDITAVCYREIGAPLEPDILRAYILSTMNGAADTGICRVYKR